MLAFLHAVLDLDDDVAAQAFARPRGRIVEYSRTPEVAYTNLGKHCSLLDGFPRQRLSTGQSSGIDRLAPSFGKRVRHRCGQQFRQYRDRIGEWLRLRCRSDVSRALQWA